MTRRLGDPVNLLPERIRALDGFSGRLDGFQLAADGCLVLFVAARAGAEIGAHTHDTENVSVILSGEMVALEGGDEHRYGPGDWYRTAPGTEHALRFPEDTVQVEFRFDAEPDPASAG
jgi:quercetin dioxygenase-like cupin family protein